MTNEEKKQNALNVMKNLMDSGVSFEVNCYYDEIIIDSKNGESFNFMLEEEEEN